MEVTDFERLKIFRNQLNFQQGEFAETLGLKQSSYSDIERGKNGISYSVLKTLMEVHDLNPDWLIFGNEPKMKKDLAISKTRPAVNYQPVATINTAGKASIVLVDSKTASGYVKNRSEVSFIQKLPSFTLPGAEFQESYRAFEVEGDSMHDTLVQGDWVIAKQSNAWRNLLDGHIYVVVTQDRILIKRISLAKLPDFLVCSSEKEEYAPFEVPIAEVVEIWQVTRKITSYLSGQNAKLSQDIKDLKSNYDELAKRLDRLKK